MEKKSVIRKSLLTDALWLYSTLNVYIIYEFTIWNASKVKVGKKKEIAW